ncbi:MAG TPA: hypothetical protein VF053_06545 [Streptosporangiales bacterium]
MPATLVPPRTVPAPPRPSPRRTWLPLAAWTVLVAGCIAVGVRLRADGLLRLGGLPPFHGWPRAAPLTWQLLPALAFAALALTVAPRLARTLRWRALLPAVWLATAAWACLLAASDGVGALATPIAGRDEYLGVAAGIGTDPFGWLHGFAANVAHYPTHVAGHPPLPVLIFWALDAVGLGGPGAAAALCILLGGSASAAVLVTVRCLASEEHARGAAPFLALAPYVLTVATSADAMFLGVSAWGVALLASAVRRDSPSLGVASGVLLAATAYLNYGLLPLAAIPLVVLWRARFPLRPLVGLGVGAALVVAAFTAGGFWWPDGVAATHARWAFGSGSKRPYWYVLVANLALFAVITGPATAAALARLRRGAWPLVGAALLAVAVLDLSGVTRGEVERIWLPFAAWVMLAASALPRAHVRRWLLAQVAVAVLVQGTVRLLW